MGFTVAGCLEVHRLAPEDAGTEDAATPPPDAGDDTPEPPIAGIDWAIVQVAMRDRGRACGHIGAGPLFPFAPAAPALFIEADPGCVARCIAEASCAAYEAYACTRQVTDVTRCTLACVPAYRCGNDQAARCDGVVECANGDDERGCATWTCDDGSAIPPHLVCDLVSDCADGSDEDARCEHFTCADGQRVPRWQLCDLYPQCTGGDDEAGCAVLACE